MAGKLAGLGLLLTTWAVLSPEPTTQSVTGVVLDSDRTPVPAALVTATVAGGTRSLVLSDAQGRYVLQDVPVGQAIIEASKHGYVPGRHGQRSPRGPAVPLEIRDGTRLTGVNVPLWKYAVIAGRVADADGEPLPAVTVEALRRDRSDQGDALVSGGAVVTDDRGVFRLSTLVAGTYLLAVRPSPTRNRAPHFVYPGRLYPNAMTTSLAMPLEVKSGQEITDIDFRLSAESTSPIHGQIKDVDGAGRELDVYLFAVAADALARGLWLGRTRSGADGRFSFGAVHAGAYVVRATLNPQPEYLPGHAIVTQMNRGEWATLQLGVGTKPLMPSARAPGFYAEAEVTLDGREPVHVMMTLKPSARIRGRVVFAGAQPPAEELLRTAVLVQALDGRVLGSMTAARLESDSTFQTAAVPPGQYGLNWIGLSGWALRTVEISGRDVTDNGLEHSSTDLDRVVITLTSRAPEISGFVRDEKGMPAAGGSVLLFPADRLKWRSRVPAVRRFKELRTGSDGAFHGSALLEGDYFVVAPRDEVPDYWQTPEILERLVLSATRVRLTDGGRIVQDLRLSDLRVRAQYSSTATPGTRR